MNNFDEFLKSKVNEEKEKFTLPKDVDSKIEETLEGLQNSKKSNINKKALAMVASLTLIVLVGIKVIFPIGAANDKARAITPDMAKESREEVSFDTINMNDNEQNSKQDITYDYVLNRKEIISIEINCEDSNVKNKVINNENGINKIVSFINSISVQEVPSKELDSWDFLIETKGDINHLIILKDNTMNIDDKSYEINSENINSLKELYNKL